MFRNRLLPGLGVSLLASVLTTVPVASQAVEPFVEITASRVNIRTAPRLSSAIVTRARRGDIFRLRSRRGRWYEIELFTGEPRYVFAELARPTRARPPAIPAALRKRVEKAAAAARDRARREAAAAVPLPQGGGSAALSKAMVDRAVDRELFLVDRYMTAAFHRLGLSPAAYGLERRTGRSVSSDQTRATR